MDPMALPTQPASTPRRTEPNAAAASPRAETYERNGPLWALVVMMLLGFALVLLR